MRFVWFRAVIALLVFPAIPAGVIGAQRSPDVRGLHVGIAGNATSIKFDETSFSDDERENGYGIDLKLGYNFMKNFGVLLSGTAASINDSGTSDFTVAHADLGIRALFPGRSPLVPYLDLALAGIAAEYVAEGDEVEIEGMGVSFGGGLNYFFSRRAAFDVSFRYTTGDIDDVKIAGRAIDANDVGFNTTRFNIGIAFYP